MPDTSPLLILGSGSPRRAELLSLLLPRGQFVVAAAENFTEPTCDHATSLDDVRAFVASLSEQKAAVVANQTVVAVQQGDAVPILTADTVVVAQDGRRYVSLGKPPADETKETVLRHWWCDLLSSRPHEVMTAFTLMMPDRKPQTHVVRTTVTFTKITDAMATWYLSTGEPDGKAGGYAIQGHGALFVERLDGSFSNVVGLPIWELREVLSEAGIVSIHNDRSPHL